VLLGPLRGHFGNRLEVGEPTADGRVAIDIGFAEEHDPSMELAGYGAGLEVLAPAEVRTSLGEIGAVLVDRYGAA
jgi:hypothetical protein